MAPLRLDVTATKESVEAILHYKRKIIRSLEEDEQDLTLYCLGKLAKIIVNVSVLQETNVGKVINNLRKHDNEVISSKAKEIVCSWREIVQEEVEETEAEQERPQSLACKAARNENGEKSKHSSKNEHKSREPEVKGELNRKRKLSEDSKEGKRKVESREREKKQVESSKEREKEKNHNDREREKRHKDGSKDRERDKYHKDGSKDRERDKYHKDGSKDRERDKYHKDGSKDREREKTRKDSYKEREKEKSLKDRDSSRSSNKSHKNKSKGGDSMGFEDALMAVSKENTYSKKSSYSKLSDNKFITKATGHSSKDFTPPQLPPLPPLFDVPCDISPNYVPQKRPLPNATTTRYNPLSAKFQDESLSVLISMSKNSKRTAVYSGSKRSVFGDSVPTLFELCIHVLQEHVDDIAECGGLPYHVLEPVLERARPESLLTIEEYNPYLIEDTGGLWERICRREFPREQRQEFESWREVYDRCLTERQQKLDLLTVRVQQSYKNVQTTSRKAKLAYVDSVAKPPREVQRAQDKNGTAPVQAPSVRETVKKMGGPPRPRGEGRRADGFQAAAKAKKSPMMLKSLKLMHGIKTNFRK